MADHIGWYNANVKMVFARYEQLSGDCVHSWLLDLLPQPPATVLDVGAGSGRDAAWLSSRGHDVVAVEPAAAMRKAAADRHVDASVRWIDDRLPTLKSVTRSGLSFDVILLSAVWMHLPGRDRPRAFRKLINLLKPGGLLAITLRCGPRDRERGIHTVSSEEIEVLARNHGALVVQRTEAKDLSGHARIRWVQMAIRLPDDGTGALPLLRSIVLNDSKSSTYKLALLRALCRIADGAAGLARAEGDKVAVPLGLVSLYWLRLYKPLLSAGLPQNPRNTGYLHLQFVKAAYRALSDVSPLDLRVGMRFSGTRSVVLHQALKDAAHTIQRMPAHYIRFPDGEMVLPVTRAGGMPQPSQLVLNRSYLSRFGEMMVPTHLWRSLQRFGVWIEPAIVAEWGRLIKFYASRVQVHVDDAAIAAAMTWEDPTRDVQLARKRALEMSSSGKLSCVWSGRRLDGACLEVDHCLPWIAWPCGDLWNLMPTHRSINQSKRADLPSDRLMRSAQERITEWWETAYVEGQSTVSERFWLEAQSSLPAVPAGQSGLGDVFDAVCLQRIRLKQDQQVHEWSGDL